MRSQILKNNPLDIIDLNKLDITFNYKPIIVGVMAMEYYGIKNTVMILTLSCRIVIIKNWRTVTVIPEKICGVIWV